MQKTALALGLVAGIWALVLSIYGTWQVANLPDQEISEIWRVGPLLFAFSPALVAFLGCGLLFWKTRVGGEFLFASAGFMYLLYGWHMISVPPIVLVLIAAVLAIAQSKRDSFSR